MLYKSAWPRAQPAAVSGALDLLLPVRVRFTPSPMSSKHPHPGPLHKHWRELRVSGRRRLALVPSCGFISASSALPWSSRSQWIPHLSQRCTTQAVPQNRDSWPWELPWRAGALSGQGWTRGPSSSCMLSVPRSCHRALVMLSSPVSWTCLHHPPMEGIFLVFVLQRNLQVTLPCS